jgi:hypothetical protein
MHVRLPASVVAGLLIAAVNASAAETARSSVTVVAAFSSRTTLQISSDRLQFDVTQPQTPATASIDFLAAARPHAGDLVVLSIEPVASNRVPSTLSFSGEGEGTRSGTVAADRLSIAGQWIGSGVRHGRLVFTLHADAAGAFNVPIRLVLSAP